MKHVLGGCDGCNGLGYRNRAWHGTYSAWYDHNQAGHTVRAESWSRVNNGLARVLNVIGWGRLYV